MLVVICGPSGSGKSELSKALRDSYGAKEVVAYTTRNIRENEVQDVDYHFVSNEQFKDMIENDELLEFEEYSQSRFYGKTKASIQEAAQSSDLFVAVSTPNGMRAIEKCASKEDVFTVYVTASLGTRVKRYIDRVGESKFTFDDMNEINARVNRDFGMFLNVEKEVDMVVDNSKDDKDALLVFADKIYEIYDNVSRNMEDLVMEM